MKSIWKRTRSEVDGASAAFRGGVRGETPRKRVRLDVDDASAVLANICAPGPGQRGTAQRRQYDRDRKRRSVKQNKAKKAAELEEEHRQNMEAAHKKSGEALKAEFAKGKEVGEKDESIKNEATTKEDNRKANEHQQETTRQAAKERKEGLDRKEKEHKTEVDRLSKEKTSMTAAAGVVREKLAQVEAKVETLLQEKAIPSFVVVNYSVVASAPVLTDSVLLGG